jgi:hypothetical protein
MRPAKAVAVQASTISTNKPCLQLENQIGQDVIICVWLWLW